MVCSGCTKAGMSEARRDHILAGDHGWIDITVHAPASAPATGAGAKACALSYLINGETLLSESAELSGPDENKMPVGYRFAAPAGALKTALVLSHCVGEERMIELPLTLEKDHLATLLFDGKSLVLQQSTPYDPATLDSVRAEINKLHDGETRASGALSTLTWLAMAILVLNLAAFLYMFVRMFLRRRHPPGER
ncbi:hypothetical protein C7C56_025410 [Massilia glaciei]|uniref:Uncharacterized protein n=2 Tax=Massilia glaciei TaxID=1524097 RepID=A0A2U2HDH3_9BURK|nr:hypothetical protein C7C56_025410 [Massilia glaciei]